ncbi:synaptojanin [Geosmithia morbida]|uniref:phosphoinositide 5-phosphatase n=1 Tax=Geosmithia morbida TaxID=1094350 RepID=A0A9P4YV20_9HYPO|nr:synaptojanin [Geosmithia morbida]KAF4122575.1 synaptojanin [Geosmithia morbida]
MDSGLPHAAGAWSAQAPAPEKSCELYIRDYPHRSIAIVSTSHVLILRYSSVSNDLTTAGFHGSHTSLASSTRTAGNSTPAKCMVEFSRISEELLREYRPLAPRPIFGTLGLITVEGEVFLAVISHAARAATVRPGETVERIGGVAFYCLSSADYDDVVPLDALEQGDVSDAMSVSGQSPYGGAGGQNLGRREVALEHPCHELRKLLSNGSFYYSTDFDVTNRAQDRPINSNSFDIDNFDDAFLWNSFMISPLVQFRSCLGGRERSALDRSRILTSAFRGFSETMTIPPAASPLRARSGMPSYMTLISRLSCRRAGTRFNARGIDDDGHVANFVETETTFWSPAGVFFSYVQVRGSVPVFWEQAADLVPGRQKITVTRSPEGTQPALDKHFEELEQTYGAIHVVNLLSESKSSEVELSSLYTNGIRHCPLSRPSTEDSSPDSVLLRETRYDFHAETKGPAGYEAARGIRRYIEDSIDAFAYYLAEERHDVSASSNNSSSSLNVLDGVGSTTLPNRHLEAVQQQQGVFRTNCLDCLDRTNLIQTLISQMAVEAFLGHRGLFAASDFWMRHSSLWADNGDSLSKIYAGTGALKSSFTRHGKMSLAGAVADMRKSVQRIYHNNFIDPSRQITIDMLLGRLVGQAPVHLFDPISDYVSAELARRSPEYTSHRDMTMWVGTFNLNGRTEGVEEDLSPWLFPRQMAAAEAQPEIYAVGFQEIVELSPQQIMNSDPSRRALWEGAVLRTLNRRQASLGGEKYVLLRSGQLVGAALCIFVRASSLGMIRNVEGSVRKTGMSGMAGNKGAVAIRFDYANTHICFVTAHLAAGFYNAEERNRDYATIHHGLRFQRNRGIDDHDSVIWLGDFNYRIGLTSEMARALVRKRDLGLLYENDQLNLQMVAGLVFPYYSEARINFLPTYRFDIGTDDYDTSEKARIPAWTDRILRKGSNLRQILYDCAPLRFSDHRPVHAAFVCRVSIVDEARRDSISQELYMRRKAEGVDAMTGLPSSSHAGGGGAGSAADDSDDEEDLIGYDAVEPGLPPASSDRNKWWLENRQPARAQVPIPSGRDGQPMVLNPNRPSNPFGHGEEQDWISVSRSSSRASLSSLSSSPYEKVMLPSMMMNSSASSTAPRRLPPPPSSSSQDTGSGNAAARTGRMSLASGGGHQASSSSSTPPPPPPPRRQGTGNSAATSPSSPAQAVGGGIPMPGMQTQMMQGNMEPLVPTRSAASQPAASFPVATKTAAGNDAAAAGPAAAGPAAKTAPPPVAKKPAHLVTSPTPTPTPTGGSGVGVGVSRSQAPGPVDLLDSMDEGGRDMGGWETLQPSR